MLLNYILVFLLSMYVGITSANVTVTSNSETQILKNSAPLATVPIKQDLKESQIKKVDKSQSVLSRGVAPTDTNSIPNNSSIDNLASKYPTERSNASISNANVGVVKNNTISIATAFNTTKILTTTSTTAAPKIVVNPSTQVKLNSSETVKINNGNSTIKTTLTPLNKTSKVLKSSTTTTTTTTSTTTSTTTPKPKKPKVTYSEDDMPEIAKTIPDHPSSISKFTSETKSSAPKLTANEAEPIAQPSREYDGTLYRNHRDYIIPIVSIIFAVPILMGMVIVAYRRFRDFWSTRHYRRMDFLVDEMYND